MNTAQARTELANSLLLLSGLGSAQVRGLIDFVNPKASATTFSSKQLEDLIREENNSLLELVIASITTDSVLPSDRIESQTLEDFTTLYLIHELRVLFNSLSVSQLMKLFEIIPTDVSFDVQLKILTQLQTFLKQLEPQACKALHEEISRAELGTELQTLETLVPLESQDFHLYQPLLGILRLEEDELFDLQQKLPKLEYVQLIQLLRLLVEEPFNVLDFRHLLTARNESDLNQNQSQKQDLNHNQPQSQLQTVSQSNLNQSDNHDNPQSNDLSLRRSLNLEIVEQPPQKCVYKRNVKPAPTVMVVGDDARIDGNLFVVPLLVRCDTFEEVPDLIAGNKPMKVTSARVLAFKRLKILSTSHQLKETLFSVKFELRRYNASNNYTLLNEITTNPIIVLSHSTQLKPVVQSKPSVQEVIPCSGPSSGSTRVVVLGNNFADSPTIRVKFDTIEVMPIFYGPKTLICHTPNHSPGTVTVRVCNDAKRWSDSVGTFTYTDHNLTEEGRISESIDSQFNLNIVNSIYEAVMEGGFQTVRILNESDGNGNRDNRILYSSATLKP